MRKILIVASLIFLSPYFAGAVTITASRTSGVAPLSVHFYDSDATGSGGTFHTYRYSWSFDDSEAGTWGTNGKSKNAALGPVAGHVFESAGTYTVTLTVTNSGGTVGSDTETITVTDPDTVFSTTNTTCVSTSGTFTGCPSGANQVTTSDLTTLTGYADAGERILFRKGESWTLSSNASWPTNSGPVQFGAYGSEGSVDDYGIDSNAPTIAIGDGLRFLTIANCTDWRITDITFSANKTAAGGNIIEGMRGHWNCLIHKVKATGNTLFTNSAYRISDTEYIDALCIASCRVSGTYGPTAFLGSERLALLGTEFYSSDNSHCTRVWHFYRGVINSCIIAGGGMAAVNLDSLKLHGPKPTDGTGSCSEVGTVSEQGTSSLRYLTQMGVISDNLFGQAGDLSVTIGPQNAAVEENLSDIIFERNQILLDYGTDGEEPTEKPAYFWGRYFTIRNNIIDGSGGKSDSLVALAVERRGIEHTPLGNRIYNNTIFSDEAGLSTARGIQIGSDASDTIIRNNYICMPNVSETQINDLSGSATNSNNVTTNSSGNFVDPINATPEDRSFKLTTSATDAIDQGYDLKSAGVLEDFDGDLRTGTLDAGADEYGNEAEASQLTGGLSGCGLH